MAVAAAASVEIAGVQSLAGKRSHEQSFEGPGPQSRPFVFLLLPTSPPPNLPLLLRTADNLHASYLPLIRPSIAALLSVCLCGSSGFAQSLPSAAPVTQVPSDLLRVHIDCTPCDLAALKTAIDFVSFVPARDGADVEVTGDAQSQPDASRKWTFVVTGQQRFAGQTRTLSVVTSSSQSADDVRASVARLMKLALTDFAATTSIGPQLYVSHHPPNLQAKTVVAHDPWNYWVFRLGANGFLNGEETSASSNFFASASANRVTENWKWNFNVNRSVNRNRFDVEGDEGEPLQFTSRTSEWNTSGLIVKSLGPHWSAGVSTNVSHSSYSNEELTSSVGPGIEYDIFPYAESSKRSVTIQYNVYTARYTYAEETIFGKLKEVTPRQQLSASMGFQQKWGSANASCTFSQQLDHLEREHVSLFGGFNVRILKGLTVNGFASFSRIRDQFSLPKGDASEEDVLLRLRQLETGHRASMSFGVSYSFGSLSNKTVNPRFNN